MRKPLVLLILFILMTACSGGDGSINGKPLDQTGDPAPALTPVVKEPLDILVFGGTSGIGLQTVKLALERGHTVTSVTRRPERMSVEHPNLTNAKGDITKPDTFQDLVPGKDAIVSAIGLKPTRKEVTVYSEGMKQVLASMQDSGVNRVLTITGIGAGDSKGHGGFFYDRILNPLVLKTDYADKNRQEQLLRESNVDWTIVRPGFLTDNEAERRYWVLQNLEGVTSGEIARADVAHFLLAAIEQGSYIQDTVLLSN